MPNRLNMDAIRTYYDVPPRSLLSRLAFPVGKLYTDSYTGAGAKYSPWDEIEDGIFVGKIICESECDSLIEFVNNEQEKNPGRKKRPLKLVVSVLDYFELGGSFPLQRIATPKDWIARGVTHCSLPIKDFGAVAFDDCISKTIHDMRKCWLEGGSVYVHCKAGRGRSAMVCAIYLAVFHDLYAKLELDEAFVHANLQMSGKRSQVKLDEQKSNKAKQVIRHIRAQASIKTEVEEPDIPENFFDEDKSISHEMNFEEKLDNYLASSEAKVALSEMVYFKEIAIYAAYHDAMIVGKTDRCEVVKGFLDEMFYATDAKWFRNYHKPDSYIQRLLDVEPLTNLMQSIGLSFFGGAQVSEQVVEEDKKLRQEFVVKFFEEVVKHLCTQLNCDSEALMNLSKKEVLSSSSQPNLAHM
ncbi:MAG: hypothetical protein P4M12_01530 [Gammaproteobacteria bacterium]|nr:hypothetical protein [Gammaproteobacteria bacterium]